jgi:plasmid maintenance system antidote protein VapI
MKEKIHIGNIIKQKLEEKDLKIAWLARQIFYDESNLCKKLKNNDIDTNLLYRISDTLHEDFFAYYSNDLNKKWQNLP